MSYEDYENYYEPSEVDELVEEFKDKIREYILPDIKSEIERITKENLELKASKREYQNLEHELRQKQRELEWKEKNLKAEVEREFNKKNIDDVLEDYIEKSEVWFGDSKSFKGEKCSLCDEERKLKAIFPNGEIAIIMCDCNKFYYKYVPEYALLTSIDFYKRDENYRGDYKKFYLHRSFTPAKEYRDRNDESYRCFSLCHILEKFEESTKELHKDTNYDTKIGFTTIEECQKYCDWLEELKAEKKGGSNNE